MKKFLYLPIFFILFAIFSGLLFFAWNLWAASEATRSLRQPETVTTPPPGCTELRPELGPYQEVSILNPGSYCIAVDFRQTRLSDGAGHNGPAPYHHLIGLTGGDVRINLMNHRLQSDGHSSGIFTAVQSNLGSVINKTSGYGQQTQNIEVKNGVIDLRGLGTGVAFINRWDMRKIDATAPKNLQKYEKSNFILENLFIKTDNIGIILEGDGNIIRNCVIESGGSSAITMAGPNGKIIDNTIILMNPKIPSSMAGVNFSNIELRHISEFLEETRSPKSAISLHEATGTVISGNRIEVKGKSELRHHIYLTDASMAVRIENNTFDSGDDIVTLVKGSTAIMKNNVRQSKRAWWQF